MKLKTCLLLLPLMFASVGCTSLDRLAHELQPHRLWRINRGPAPGREDAGYFSVHDVEAEGKQESVDGSVTGETGN